MIQNPILNRIKSRPITDNALSYDAILQWWYFDAVFENGYRLITFLMPKLPWIIQDKDHPLNKPLPFFEIILRDPKGKIIRERRFIETGEMDASPETFNTSFGPGCSFSYQDIKGTKNFKCYKIKGRIARLEYDLDLYAEIPCWAPLGSRGKTPRPIMMAALRSLSTRDYLYYVPFVPRGRINGSISIDGKMQTVRGTGYHEQGRTNFPLYNFIPSWYWLHIEHPPWTILSAAAPLPAGYPNPEKGTHGGLAFVQKDTKRLFSAMDYSGLFVNWQRIGKRDPHAAGEESMAWEVDLSIRRPGLKINAEINSKDVLEYLHFTTPGHESGQPYWGQTIADARVEITHGREKTIFETECQVETVNMA